MSMVQTICFSSEGMHVGLLMSWCLQHNKLEWIWC